VLLYYKFPWDLLLESLMKYVWSDETRRIINKVDKISCCVLLTSPYLGKITHMEIFLNEIVVYVLCSRYFELWIYGDEGKRLLSVAKKKSRAK